MQLFSFYAGNKRKRKDEPGAARLTPASRGDLGCLQGSGGLPLALHRGAATSGRIAAPQASATAWGQAAATAGGVARRRVGEAWGASSAAIRAGTVSSIVVEARPL